MNPELRATERATSLLTHYVTLLMNRAGLKVDEDTTAELQECVEAIVEAAALRAKREANEISATGPALTTEAKKTDEIRAALEAARYALTVSHGLTATDQPGAFEDAQNDGCDANGARDAQREVSWEIDNSKEIALIDAALAGEQ